MHSEDNSLGKLYQYLTAHLLQFGFLPIVYIKVYIKVFILFIYFCSEKRHAQDYSYKLSRLKK